MSMGKRKGQQQAELWLPTTDLASSPGHPFYEKLNAILAEAGFDVFVEELCQPFYADGGRRGIAPGVYFRMLLVGYFEGIQSERGIAWRCADSLALRSFLGYSLTEATPDHSSLTRIRQRLDADVHEAVFDFVLKILSDRDLLPAKTVGIDGTTLEANAALRSIVRRDTGEGYEEYLKGLAEEAGIENPTSADLVKLDRKRPRKGSNAEWRHPHEPDSQITKMKDGRTHLAHKSEHAVDMESGAVVAVTLHGGAAGDTRTILETMKATCEKVAGLGREEVPEWVADKGYHSNEIMQVMDELELRSYISEPARGRRNWKGKQAAKKGTYANRRRTRGDRGKRLMRRRGEFVERSFAHCLETGALRRTCLRGHENIRKRYLVHVAGFNLGLVMRKLFGAGTPRGTAALRGALAGLLALVRGLGVRLGAVGAACADSLDTWSCDLLARARFSPCSQSGHSSTGC